MNIYIYILINHDKPLSITIPHYSAPFFVFFSSPQIHLSSVDRLSQGSQERGATPHGYPLVHTP